MQSQRQQGPAGVVATGGDLHVPHATSPGPGSMGPPPLAGRSPFRKPRPLRMTATVIPEHRWPRPPPVRRPPAWPAWYPVCSVPPGQRPGMAAPTAAAAARQVVLLVVDGLGWDPAPRTAPTAPGTAPGGHGPAGPITSVVPTTTATALTSIALGAPPADHGMVGFRMRVRPDPTDGPDEVLNVLGWRTSGRRRPPSTIDPHDCSSRPPAFAVAGPVPVDQPSREFAGSGFTEAHLRGGRL